MNTRALQFLFTFSAFLTLNLMTTADLSAQYDRDVIAEAASDIGTIRSLLVYQNGELLTEKTFKGGGSDTPYNIKSASKSVIGLLTGIAIDKGIIPGTDTKISMYFPEYFRSNPDSLKASITVGDLLTMRSGLETTSFYNYGKWVISDDWVEYQLDQPLTEKIGGKMVYSTGTTHLLSVIISRASGMTTRAFADQHLFEPLDIRVGGWDKDPKGNYMGGNNLALSPNALLKLGKLILKDGNWDGVQVISSDWLDRTFSSYTRSNFNPYDYGYLWWIIDRRGVQINFAWGFGGQYLFIIPEYDAVVVITNSLANADQRRSYKEPIFDLLENEILPFLRK